MLANAGENIAQVSFGLEAVHFCGADERVKDRGAFSSGVAASEEPVFPSKAYRPDGVFGGVVGDLQPPIGAIAGERLPAGARIAVGFGKIALAGDKLQLRIHPGRQRIELGFGLFHSHRLPAAGWLARDPALDLEQLSDFCQRLLGDGRAVALVLIEELAPDVSLMRSSA